MLPSFIYIIFFYLLNEIRLTLFRDVEFLFFSLIIRKSCMNFLIASAKQMPRYAYEMRGWDNIRLNIKRNEKWMECVYVQYLWIVQYGICEKRYGKCDFFFNAPCPSPILSVHGMWFIRTQMVAWTDWKKKKTVFQSLENQNRILSKICYTFFAIVWMEPEIDR